ncbi:hypothetical protein DOK78_000521 [Enterococcus sp. DIV2402]|uniref:Uncharacterized protein n=1 Tax=Candidatus Enterococcus lowellii TaxID=2230877 RepID=A0ABZ2SKC1_9ENTE|nr:hypothetical protein [Enterococcus sp. DIV2402]MBO0465266.1 hypothetical protein [Enterococcus sp. DIV2402]
MSDRERQKKFEQQSYLKSSEFDRHNTNMTRQANPIGRGQNLLPSDRKRKKIEQKDLIVQMVSVVVGIVVFFFVMYLGKILLPQVLYEGMSFLIVDLGFSIMVAYLFFSHFSQ